MATKTMSPNKGANGTKPETKRPIWSKRYWPVNVAVFEFVNDGRANFSIEVSRTFRRDPEKSEWEKSFYLSSDDLLPAAKLLEEAYAVVQERIQEAIAARDPKTSSNGRELSPF